MRSAILILSVILVLALNCQTQGIDVPVERPNRDFAFRVQDISGIAQSLADQSTRSAISSNLILRPIQVDTYNLANLVWNAQRYFPYCDRCKVLEYFAFRVGSNYLTARPNLLRLQSSSSPTNAQLFIAQQQVDGSWAFKSLTQNRYIRASNDGVTINYQTFVGAWERWYIERHGAHVHIQSAQFAYHWWVFNNSRLQQLNGGASALIVEHWPKLQWLWNW